MIGFFLSFLAYSCLASGLALAFGALMEVRHAFRLWISKRIHASDARGTSGIFDVRGRVHAEIPLQAPLTGRNCVQFTVVMERKTPRAGQKRDDRPDLITFVGASPFFVEDATGKVRVDLREKRVPVTGTSVERRPLERLTQPLERLLQARIGAPGGLWCMNRDVVATEAVLLDGAEVSVVASRDNAGNFKPLHVTTGRLKVVAMQLLMRAGMAMCGAAVLVALFQWLR